MNNTDTESLAGLLEFTLASYEGMCESSRPNKKELKRYEDVLKKIFLQSTKSLRSSLGPRPAFGQSYNRVRTVLRYTELGDSTEDAIARNMLVVRFGNKDAHRE